MRSRVDSIKRIFMSIPKTTHKRADAISLGILLIGFGVLSFLQSWFPGIFLVIGIALVVRQYLRGRIYDIFISVLIFGGLFLYFRIGIHWDILLPVLFTIAGIYLIFREYFVKKDRTGEDLVEDESQEVEELEDDSKSK